MDRALVEAARSGDEEAFASIARGSADRLFRIAHRILRDVGRAEDAVQQTLVTAWTELPGLREIRTLRSLDPPDPGQCLLCGSEAGDQVVCQRRGPDDRGAIDTGRRPGRRDARCPRAWVPPAADGATRRLRPPSLPRLVARRDRRDARRPDRDGQVEASIRHLNASGLPWRLTPERRPLPLGSGWHDGQRVRTDGASLARRRPEPDLRSRRAVRARPDPCDSTAPLLGTGAEVFIHGQSTSPGGGAGGRRAGQRHRALTAPGGRLQRRPRGPTASPDPHSIAHADPVSADRRRSSPHGRRHLRHSDPFLARVTFTLPGGWEGNMGGPYFVDLGQVSGPTAVTLGIFDTVYADPCDYSKGPIAPRPGSSVDELANALAALPNLRYHANGYHHRRLPREAAHDDCSFEPGRVQPVAGRRHADLGLPPGGHLRHDRWCRDTGVDPRRRWATPRDPGHGTDGPDRGHEGGGPGRHRFHPPRARHHTDTQPLLKGAIPCVPDSSSPCPSRWPPS